MKFYPFKSIFKILRNIDIQYKNSELEYKEMNSDENIDIISNTIIDIDCVLLNDIISNICH